MASKAEGSGKGKEGKKEHKNKPVSVKYKKYQINGESVKRAKSCPRCGAGIFLAMHKDRMHCGKCNYTEFSKK